MKTFYRITAYLRYDRLLRTVLTMDKTFAEYHRFLKEALANGYEIDVSYDMIALVPDFSHVEHKCNFLVEPQGYYDEYASKNDWDFESDAPKEVDE